jgi:hypothetical protein
MERRAPKRHLLRLWSAVPGARSLPKIYVERFGNINIGDRGGIIVPGSMLRLRRFEGQPLSSNADG